jgi:hypothetical protein
MERLESEKQLEPTQTPQNDPKKKKKNLQYPLRFSPENLHKNNPNQNKNQEIKPKFFYCYEPYQER